MVDVKDLLPDAEIERTRDALYDFGANVKRSYNTAAYNNLDVYQMNCTYYSALGNDDAKYLLARAVQMFTPGTPMVYYVGLLAGKNDIELLEKTKVGRNINRHYYTAEEIDREVERPVVRKLIGLLEARNSFPAFDGEFSILPAEDGQLNLQWKKDGCTAELRADFKDCAYEIRLTEPDGSTRIMR